MLATGTVTGICVSSDTVVSNTDAYLNLDCALNTVLYKNLKFIACCYY